MYQIRSVLLFPAIMIFGLIGYVRAPYSFIETAQAQEDLGLQDALATAKIAGACGIMDEMIDFQAKTKLPGGDEFVSRFWVAESARRGMTVKEVSDQCDKAIILYDRMWKAAKDSE